MLDSLLKNLSPEQYQQIIIALISVMSVVIGFTYKYLEKHFKLRIQLYKDKIEMLNREIKTYKELKEDKYEQNKLMKIYDFSGENSESERHLLSALANAKEEIFVFGLTRHFYSEDKIQNILIEKSESIPINIIMMDPDGKSKKERYRLEPSRAAYRNSSVYKEKVEKTFLKLMQNSKKIKIGSKDPGICFCYYDFPCSFAMEKIDNQIRVFLYGYGKRGTDSPTFIFDKGHSCYEYFNSQIDWMKEHGKGNGMPQWDDSGIIFTNIANKSLQQKYVTTAEKYFYN